MAVPSAEKLQKITTELLQDADPEQLSTLTVRIVREKLEKQLGLSSGTLDAKEFKVPIKKAVVDYLGKNSKQNETDGEESQPKTSKKRKTKADEETRKSASKPKTSSKKKQIPKSSAVVESDASESSGDEAPSRRKQAKPLISNEADDKHGVKPIASKKASEIKNPSSRSAVKLYKSVEIIESSGDEADSKLPSNSAVVPKKPHSPLEEPLSKPKSSTKRKAEQIDESQPGAGSSFKSEVNAGGEAESDSSLSAVIDEPPKKRKKKQDKDSSKKGPTEKKRRKSNSEGLSKDDEAVSKLKAIVVACGVRKVWKKEFANLDTSSGQIKRLKEILKDLGMSGRPSLDKAKSIRAQRELAQELKDVQEFAEASRRREMRKENGTSGDESSGSGSDDNNEGLRVTKKKTAGASILAFLQDQSDEE